MIKLECIGRKDDSSFELEVIQNSIPQSCLEQVKDIEPHEDNHFFIWGFVDYKDNKTKAGLFYWSDVEEDDYEIDYDFSEEEIKSMEDMLGDWILEQRELNLRG